MQNRTEKIKLITGRLMRGPSMSPSQAVEVNADPAKALRFMIENAVAAGLAYRDSEDVQVPLDIAEARELVENWNAAIEAESDEAIDRSGDAMASYIRGLANQAALAFGEPTEKGK